MTATQIRVVITLAVVIWGILALFEGLPLSTTYLKPYSLVVGIMVVLGMLYDLYLWRWWPLSVWGPRPILRGTWAGELRSTWKTENGDVIPPIPVYMVINQRASNVAVKLMTEQSKSVSTSASITEQSGDYVLASTYRNVPRILLRKGSPVHHGSLVFEIGSRFPRRLHGSYWTDRATMGELELTRYSPKTFEDFESAAEGEYSGRGVRPRLGPIEVGR